MIKKKEYIYLLMAALLLSPIIFFPFSGDQSIFALGGNYLLDGKVLYSELIDLKPPMVFIFYGFIGIFADMSEVGYRLFEYLWQLTTVSILFLVVKKYFDLISAIASALIYCLLFVSMNYAQTLQPEGFINLPVILIISMMFKSSKSKYELLSIGALIGFVTAFKFSLGIFLIIILIDLFFKRESIKQFIIYSILIVISMSAVFILSFIPLLNLDSFNGYKKVLEYLSFYSAYPPINISFVKSALIKLSIFFGDNYSIAILFFTGAGIFNYLKSKDSKILFLGNLIILTLFSIVVEKKFHEYHYLRMFIPLVISAGIGFRYLFDQVKKHNCNNYCRLLSISFILLMVFLSPIPRYFNVSKYGLYKAKSIEKYNSLFEEVGSSQLLRKQYYEVYNKIKDVFEAKSSIILLATGSNQINFLLYPEYKISKFTQSQFYYGMGAPEIWLDEFRDEVRNADALVIQNNDINPLIMGHSKSTLQTARNDEIINEILNKYFVQYYQTKNFVIFKKKNNE